MPLITSGLFGSPATTFNSFFFITALAMSAGVLSVGGTITSLGVFMLLPSIACR